MAANGTIGLSVNNQMKFEILAGKRASGCTSFKDYTEWAESLLYGNVKSDNVGILASLGYGHNPDSDEIEKYFQRSLKDLGLTPPDHERGLKAYAKALCEQIVSGELEPEKGVTILETIYSSSDYEPIYGIWEGLSEDLWMINHGEECIFSTTLTLANKDAYIKRVAAQFIELSDTDLPARFFSLSVCPACGYIGDSEFEILEKAWMPETLFRLIYKRGQTRRAICANRKNPFPHDMCDYEARTLYLSKKC